MQRKGALLLVFGCLLSASRLQAQEPYQPTRLAECLRTSQVRHLTVLTAANPYYLRGDFDGDRQPDYAVVLTSASGGIGVAICRGSGGAVLLGTGIGATRFSDMPGDRFVAPQWDVLTRKDVLGLDGLGANGPTPLPKVKAESVAMIWEDAVCLIYWDGKSFRWAGARQ
jgi:hypothetical protein